MAALSQQKKLRILVIMPIWHVSAEDRFFRLVDILRGQGYDVDFCIVTDELRKKKFIHLPGMPKERLNLDKFRRRETKALSSIKDIYLKAMRAGAVIIGQGKGSHKIGHILAMLKVPTIQINDVGDILAFPMYRDILAMPGEFFRRNHAAWNKINQAYDLSGRTEITGDIRFDGVTEALRDEQIQAFYRKYRLNPDKKFALFCTGPRQRTWGRMIDTYEGVVRCLRDAGIQVVLRLHPGDVTGHKAENEGSGRSAKDMFPDLAKLDLEDIHLGTRMCSFMVVVDSTVCSESLIYQKHAVVVNLYEWCMTDDGLKHDFFPKKRFDGFKVHNFIREQKFTEGVDRKYFKPDCYNAYYRKDTRQIDYLWAGADCSLEELPEVLKSPALGKFDAAQSLEAAEYMWFKRDGKAAERVAKLLESLINEPGVKGRAHQSRFIRALNSIAYLLKFSVLQFAGPTNYGQFFKVK